jgi:hypothetical protein
MLRRDKVGEADMAKRNSGSVRRRKSSEHRKQWRAIVEAWKQGDLEWQGAWGPSPNQLGCLCPRSILVELGLAASAAA